MNRIAIIVALAGSLLINACGNESSLPNATGKGTIRAINAIATSPNLAFLIEERLISNVAFSGVSQVAEYDDLDYNFNVEALFAGETANTRIITRHLDVVAGQDYTFLISGTVANPSITLWEATVPEFAADSTQFRARFAHTSGALGSVDYYFAADGVIPVLGEQVATLSFGQISDPVDLESGEFSITITSSGDPADVLYSSSPAVFAAQNDFIISPFDGDINDNAPYKVHAFGSLGSAFQLLDLSYSATVEFLHASQDLGISDIYDDVTLTTQLVADHSFQDLSAELPAAAGTQAFAYTPAGGTAAVTLEAAASIVAGLRYRVVAHGESGDFAASTYAPDRRPVETAARILLFNASTTHDLLSYYAVAPGETIDGIGPFAPGIGTGVGSNFGRLAAGSYDIYVTEFGSTDVLAGPVRINVVLGDVLDTVAFDTVDPAILELEVLSGL